MKSDSNWSKQQQLIIDGMKLVWERLIESKRKSGGELVVMREGKIVRVKPWIEIEIPIAIIQVAIWFNPVLSGKNNNSQKILQFVWILKLSPDFKNCPPHSF